MATPVPEINQFFDQFCQKLPSIFHKAPHQWQNVKWSYHSATSTITILFPCPDEQLSLCYPYYGSTLFVSDTIDIQQTYFSELEHSDTTCELLQDEKTNNLERLTLSIPLLPPDASKPSESPPAFHDISCNKARSTPGKVVYDTPIFCKAAKQLISSVEAEALGSFSIEKCVTETLTCKLV